jgi:hypothetical protein
LPATKSVRCRQGNVASALITRPAMSKRKKNQKQLPAPPPNSAQNSPQKQSGPDEYELALEKYRELYSYSTDILLKEHERFTRADEKASHLSTTFIFLIGIVAYFNKWIFDTLRWDNFPAGWPTDLPLCMAGVVGLLALGASAAGLFMAIQATKLHKVKCRPLNHEMLEFFEAQTLITVYYGMAREMTRVCESNRIATDRKHALIECAYRLMLLVFVLLGELLVMYCLYSWC